MIETIKNYKLKEFLLQDIELVIEYVNVLQYVVPVETEQLVFDLTLREVDYIKTHLFSTDTEALVEIISTVQKIKPTEVYHMPIITFYGIYNSIKQQTESIIKGEEQALGNGIVNFKWEQVRGNERLSRFGVYNVLDNLANGDVLKYEAIFNLPYAVVMQKLVMNKIKDEIQYEMNAIKDEKIIK